MVQLKQLHKFKLTVNGGFLIENLCIAFSTVNQKRLITEQNHLNLKVGDLNKPHIKGKLGSVLKVTRIGLCPCARPQPSLLNPLLRY